MGTHDSVIELVTSAAELVDRHQGLAVAQQSTIRQIALLREAVRDSAEACPDGTASSDLDDVARELDALLLRLERAPGAAA